jgi:hypothetical protein
MRHNIFENLWICFKYYLKICGFASFCKKLLSRSVLSSNPNSANEVFIQISHRIRRSAEETTRVSVRMIIGWFLNNACRMRLSSA